MNLPLYSTLLIVTLFAGTLSGCAQNDCQTFSSTTNTPTIPDGLGVNIHFTDPQPGEMKMLADAGFRWVRMDFKWDATERDRGRYDFSPYDRLLAALEPYGIHALLILDYGNPLYDTGAPPRTAEARQAFARWAVAAAKHFSGRSVIWEVYNEPNVETFWPPRPNTEEYVALASAVGRAFYAEAPREKLIGPATSGIDFPFLEACFKAGLLDYWAAVSVHPYLRSDPEAAANDYCRLRRMIDRYRTDRNKTGSVTDRLGAADEIPIISGEWGYSSVWRGMSDEKQGEVLVREMLTNVANGVPISIWYDWRDDGADPNEPEDHFGLVRHAYQVGDQAFEPKPAYLAAKTLSEYLAGYTYQRRLSTGSDSDYVLLFGKGDELRIAAWTTSSSTHPVVVPIKEGRFKITTHTGESIGSVSSGSPGLKLSISTAPIYVTRQ